MSKRCLRVSYLEGLVEEDAIDADDADDRFRRKEEAEVPEAESGTPQSEKVTHQSENATHPVGK
eukprot:5461801-Pyramimonas_sp.AAC.1